MKGRPEKKGYERWIDLLREYDPNITFEEANYILWEFTAFPLADADYIEEQIKEYYDKKPNRR